MVTTTFKTLQTELANLIKHRSDIDLEGLKLRLDKTHADQEKAMSMELDSSERNNPDRVEIHHAWQTASTEFQRAEGIVSDMDPKIRKLEYLLGAGDQVELAAHQLKASEKRIETAQEAVKFAQKTLQALTGMVDAERALFDENQATAAATLLQAVKTGGDASSVQAASRDRLATLEQALAAAQGEKSDAQAVLGKANQLHHDANEFMRQSECAGSALNFEMVFRDYCQSLAAHRKSYWAAHHCIFKTENVEAASQNYENELEKQNER